MFDGNIQLGKRLSGEEIDNRIAFCIALQFFFWKISYSLKGIFYIGDSSSRFLFTLVLMLLSAFFFIKNLRYVFAERYILIINVYVVFVLLFTFSFIRYQEIADYIFQCGMDTGLLCLPMFFFTLSLKSYKKLYEYMVKFSYPSIILSFLAFYIHYINNSALQYDMSVSYIGLLPIIFIINDMFVKPKLAKVGFVGLGLFTTFTAGSRGPLVSMLAFIFMLFVFDLHRMKFYIKLIFGTVFGSTMLVVLNSGLIQSLANLLTGWGINSRSLYLIANEGLMDMSGRDILYRSAYEFITKNPITGYGVASDIFLLKIGYTHNVLYQIALEFGVFVLVIFIAYVIYMSICALKSKDQYIRWFYVIFFCSGFIPLLMSSTYLRSQEFFVMVAVGTAAVTASRKVKREKRKENSAKAFVKNQRTADSLKGRA